MSGSSIGVSGDGQVTRIRRITTLFLLSAVCFFPLIFNPLIFGFFDADSDAARIEHVQEHLSGMRLVFTGIGITEVALGVALWLWGRQVGDRTPGRRGDVARLCAWVGLVAGCASLVMRCSSWFEDAESIASDDPGSLAMIVGLVAFLGFSLTMITFGWLMILGMMPTWLGIVWVACGVLFWVGLLPLWFFVGALVFGIRGNVAFRPSRGHIDQICAVRPA